MIRTLLLTVWCLGLCFPMFVYAQQTCSPKVTSDAAPLITWDAPGPQPAGISMTGYKLERQKDNGSWDALLSLSASVTSYQEGTLTPGTYTWRLSALLRYPDGSTGQTPYAMHGAKVPCMTLVLTVPPSNLQLITK